MLKFNCVPNPLKIPFQNFDVNFEFLGAFIKRRIRIFVGHHHIIGKIFSSFCPPPVF
jgi:hypothetical protein